MALPNFKCTLRVKDDNNNLIFRKVVFTDDIIADRHLDPVTKNYMMFELENHGRYWLDDETMLGLMAPDNG